MTDSNIYEQLILNSLNLAHHWRLAGRWQDTLTLLYGVLPVALELDDVRRAQVWLHIARTLNDQATFGGKENQEAHHEALENAVRCAEATADASLLGVAWDSRGMAEHTHFLNSGRLHEPEHELEYFERGRIFRAQAGDPRGLAESYFHLGLVHQVVRGDSVTAEPFFERSYALAQQANDSVMQSYAIRHLGFGRDSAGDAQGARAGFQESLELRQQAGFIPGVAMAHLTLGEFEGEQGNIETARQHLQAAGKLLTELGATTRVNRVNEELSKLNGGGHSSGNG